MNRIILSEYGILPNTDITLPLYKLFSEHKSDTVFVFEDGDYYFSPRDEMKYDYRISNSDYIPERTLGIWLSDMHGCKISGNGARFWFSGHMQPITASFCSNLTLENFYINWKEPLAAEGIVKDFSDNTIDLYIDENNFPHRFCDEWLEFCVGNDEWFPLCHQGQIQFNETNRCVRRDTGDKYAPQKIEQLGEGVYRFYFNCSVDTSLGNIFVLRHNKRMHAGIFTEKCKNILFQNITVHSCGGLGCLAQFCEDITYKNVNFLPDETLGRKVSNGRDDGMHITCCRGTVTIEDCSFLGLMDDPVNIHGCCVTADEVVDEYTLRCRYAHIQARGFKYWAEQGDIVSFIERGSMETIGNASVSEYTLEGLDSFTLKFKNPISADIIALAEKGGALAIDNISNTAAFICRNNRFGSCRARGVLVSTPKSVLIEDNIFESSGSAILVAGDSNGWFESGECHDVLIRNNVFTQNCLSSMYQFCEGVISICPIVPAPVQGKPYHKNIRIENNVFDSPNVPVLYAFSCKDLRFTDNKIRKSPAASKWHPSEHLMKLSFCEGVTLKDNYISDNFSLITEPLYENCLPY